MPDFYSPAAIIFTHCPSCGAFLLLLSYWLTRKRVYILLHINFVCHYIFCYLVFLYTPLFSLCFFLLYLQNILCTKNAYSHTYTSNLHVCRISLVNFSLEVSYYLRHAVFWRYFYQHMYMVYAAFCFYYFYFFSFAEHS